MKDFIVKENEKHFFFNPQYDTAGNGLYVIRMGETFPSPNYYVERTEKILSSLGGVFVLEYVIDGEGYIECEGETYHVGAGDFYFLTRGHQHRYYSDRRRPLHKIWLNAAGELVAGLASSLSLSAAVNIVHYDAEPIFRKMQRALSAIDYSNRYTTYDRVALAVAELLLGAAAARRNEKTDSADVVYEVKRLIDSGTALDASLDDICARFLQNKSYLILRFRRTFGVTPHRYLLDRKIEAACDLLATTSISMKELAALLGFASPQYFASAFRRATGMTPGEYRESPNREMPQRKRQEVENEPNPERE